MLANKGAGRAGKRVAAHRSGGCPRRPIVANPCGASNLIVLALTNEGGLPPGHMLPRTAALHRHTLQLMTVNASDPAEVASPYSAKIPKAVRVLRAEPCSRTVFMMLDAFDTFLNAPPEHTLRRFCAIGKGVVWSSERYLPYAQGVNRSVFDAHARVPSALLGSYRLRSQRLDCEVPGAHRAAGMCQTNGRLYHHRYLNAGGVIGYRDALLAMFAQMLSVRVGGVGWRDRTAAGCGEARGRRCAEQWAAARVLSHVAWEALNATLDYEKAIFFTAEHSLSRAKAQLLASQVTHACFSRHRPPSRSRLRPCLAPFLCERRAPAPHPCPPPPSRRLERHSAARRASQPSALHMVSLFSPRVNLTLRAILADVLERRVIAPPSRLPTPCLGLPLPTPCLIFPRLLRPCLSHSSRTRSSGSRGRRATWRYARGRRPCAKSERARCGCLAGACWRASPRSRGMTPYARRCGRMRGLPTRCRCRPCRRGGAWVARTAACASSRAPKTRRSSGGCAAGTSAARSGAPLDGTMRATTAAARSTSSRSQTRGALSTRSSCRRPTGDSMARATTATVTGRRASRGSCAEQ